MSDGLEQGKLPIWEPTRDEHTLIQVAIHALHRAEAAPDTSKFLQDLRTARRNISMIIDGRGRTGKAGVR